MTRFIAMLVVALLVSLLAAAPVLAQELLDPNNCAAQGMKVGGGYECAPLDAAVIPPEPAYPAHVYQGGYHWYWYPESGWWYELGGHLYPG